MMLDEYSSVYVIEKSDDAQSMDDIIFSHFRSRNVIMYLDPYSPFDENELRKL